MQPRSRRRRCEIRRGGHESIAPSSPVTPFPGDWLLRSRGLEVGRLPGQVDPAVRRICFLQNTVCTCRFGALMEPPILPRRAGDAFVRVELHPPYHLWSQGDGSAFHSTCGGQRGDRTQRCRQRARRALLRLHPIRAANHQAVFDVIRVRRPRADAEERSLLHRIGRLSQKR